MTKVGKEFLNTKSTNHKIKLEFLKIKHRSLKEHSKNKKGNPQNGREYLQYMYQKNYIQNI